MVLSPAQRKLEARGCSHTQREFSVVKKENKIIHHSKINNVMHRKLQRVVFYLFTLSRSQLSYSKGTSCELGCNNNVSHRFFFTIRHRQQKHLLCLMTESMSEPGAVEANSEHKDPHDYLL